MTKKDRDRLFELIIFYDELTNWQNDTETEINEKDKKKLKIIIDMILALLVQYRKREGEEALKSLLVESQKFDFGIISKSDKYQLTGSFEMSIIKNAIKKVLPNCSECPVCTRKDFKKCEWFTLNKFMEMPIENSAKKECPYKFEPYNFE